MWRQGTEGHINLAPRGPGKAARLTGRLRSHWQSPSLGITKQGRECELNYSHSRSITEKLKGSIWWGWYKPPFHQCSLCSQEGGQGRRGERNAYFSRLLSHLLRVIKGSQAWLFPFPQLDPQQRADISNGQSLVNENIFDTTGMEEGSCLDEKPHLLPLC